MYNLKVNRGENCDNKKHDESLKKKQERRKESRTSSINRIKY